MEKQHPLEWFKQMTGLSEQEEEWQAVAGKIRICSMKKGEHLVNAGEPVDHAYFCSEGLFRMYYTLEDGREYNKSFAAEGDFVTSYGAMITREPSYFSIQALEDAAIIEVPYSLLQELMEREHGWERLVRKAVEQLYLKKEERERQLLFFDAATRYRAFLDKYPHIAGRLPQYHIASYLGISPVSLSRLLHAEKT